MIAWYKRMLSTFQRWYRMRGLPDVRSTDHDWTGMAAWVGDPPAPRLLGADDCVKKLGETLWWPLVAEWRRRPVVPRLVSELRPGIESVIPLRMFRSLYSCFYLC